MTRWLSRRARLTRLSWPACSAPMVGTSPMSSPACRHAIARSCIAIADSMTIGLAGGVLVLRGGEGAVAHVLVELAGGGFDRLTKLGVLPNELRDVVRVQPEDVLDNEHLSVAVWACPNADGRHRERLRHALAARAADDRTRVADHVVHRYAQRVGIAQHRVAQAVANQQHRDAGAVEPARARVVVAGEHRELLAFGLPLTQVADVGRHAAASLLGL